jgi:hypothetical protein
MIALLFFSCASEPKATRCGDAALVGSECEDFSAEAPDDRHQLEGGFPSSGDTELELPGNLLLDPGFEEGLLVTPWDPTVIPPDWTAGGTPEWLRTGAGLLSGDARSGQAVVELADGDELHQAIARLLTFDDRYVVRAWARADELSDAEISLSFLDGSGSVLAESTFPITAWPDWRAHALGAEGPDGVQSVAAAIRGTDGPVWFDDIRLEVATTDPVTFDLAATTHALEGFGAEVSPYAIDTTYLAETIAGLGLRFVRVDVASETATDKDLLATHAATGKTPWLVTAASVPAVFTDGAGALTDVAGFAAYWASRVQALDGLGIHPEAVDLVDDPSGIDDATYASLVDATRSALDEALLGDVGIAAPGTRTLLADHEARDRLLALGSQAPVSAWSFQTGDDGTLCSGGASCLDMGWDDVLGTFDAMGGTGGRPIWVTQVATAETTFFGSAWPPPEASPTFNATASVAYGVRVVDNAIASIESGAARVYFRYAVDGQSGVAKGWGAVSPFGVEKQLYRTIDLVLSELEQGADVLAAPDQTGRAAHVAVFTAPDEIVVVVTNQDSAHQPIEIVIGGATGRESVVTAKSYARYIPGDPEQGTADVGSTLNISIDMSVVDGKMAIEADLLPISATVLVFDREP